MTIRLSLVFLLFFSGALHAQVRLNEAVSSNSVYEDEDGDSPDWFELYNAGREAIDLAGYTLSDKPDNPAKWTIPNLVLPPDSYAFFWASNKDRGAAESYRTIIDRGDQFHYLRPSSAVPDDWTALGFDDSSWASGPSGFGYGDGDDATLVPAGTISLFLRRKFVLDELDNLEELFLDVDYDDGFVAYLNGTEIARANMAGNQPAWDAFAETWTEPRLINASPPARFSVADPRPLLQEGENILAIQVHNANATSSDLSLIPFLTLRFEGISNAGRPPAAVLDFPSATLHTNFKLSADGETLVFHGPDGQFIDSLGLYGLPANVSIGIPGNGGPARLFRATTPGARNPDVGFTGAVGDRVVFSHPGGPTDPLSVTLSGATGNNVIRYTLDATEPTASSPIYTTPISLMNTTVLRAAIFREGYLPSPVQSATYLMGTNHRLPIVSLVTEPDNFFHPVTGMYVLGAGYEGDFPYFGSNIWEDTEHPINFTFYAADGVNSYQLDGGVKIFGGWSRANAQRSLSLFARNRYGAGEIDFPFFPQRSFSEYQALVLRNSGNDNGRVMVRDVIMTSLLEDSNVDIQSYRSVVSYINGQYWGIYNLREKVNEHYLASLHDLDPADINLLEFSGDVVHGSNEDYLAMVNFANQNSLNVTSNYQFVADKIDLDNYIQYFAAQIYFDNRDWPGNNIKFWKPNGGKWRWILFDTDFGAGIWDDNAYNINTLAFALDGNGPNWPNPPWSTLLFRRLMGNTTFRHRFINQLADEMNSRFLSTPVINHINTIASRIESEIPRHYDRWFSDFDWNEGLAGMRTFFRNRPSRMKGFIRSQFNLPAFHRLTIRISDVAEGYVEVNSLTVEEDRWTGDYFQTVPIRVKAVAKEGYTFQHWELDNGSTEEALRLDLQRPTALRPVFSLTTSLDSPLAGSLSAISAVALSPNPSDGLLQLSFTASRRSFLRARLFDAQGRLVRLLFEQDFSAGTQVQSFEVSEQASGSYYLELTDSNGGRRSLPWLKK